MLEIPESLTIAKQLNETVRGKVIAEVETEHSKHSFAWYSDTPEEYAQKMVGCTVGEARGIGSMIDLSLGKYHFIVNDGTNIRYYEAGTNYPPKYQARILFEDDSYLICSIQMYGGMMLIIPAEYDNMYYQVALEKPQPLSEKFNYEYFKSLREDISGKMSIKAFLATEQRIPGLGNGVLQDILLEAGLHPKTNIGSLTEADWKRTYDAVVTTLKKMTEGGGRNTEKDLFGAPGGYQTKLSKKTVNGPCVYCGNTIQKAAYLGGTVYFCTECQR